MGSWESVVREVRSLIEAETGPPELSTNLWDQGNLPLVRILINSELKDLQSYNNVCNQVLDASFYGNVISCNFNRRHRCSFSSSIASCCSQHTTGLLLRIWKRYRLKFALPSTETAPAICLPSPPMCVGPDMALVAY
ncbi:hypothetical protein Peur_054728 [Populus x canadensis]|jgi:hypothetical protein|uniref:Uncharacterized protein n=1 Tax=Populus deltoides TaxID=3696 RepID=A0A8T2XUZ4_POPDE|nr:hypothetical protein H0E87_019420 [Populus deltoides]